LALKIIGAEQRLVAERLLRAKSERRVKLAALPIKEKIRMLLELQRLANDIRRKTGREPLPEWQIEP
jgi:hypothetical protein